MRPCTSRSAGYPGSNSGISSAPVSALSLVSNGAPCPRVTEALGEYQARRVNRLIVEAVCPDESLLKRGKYLSTSTGLAHLFPLLRAEGREIRHAVLYAHPAHYPRVQRQFLEAAAVAGDGGFFRSACRRVPLLMSDKTCYRPQAALKPVEGQIYQTV